MEKNFTVSMTKNEMLRFYANKIVEDGIQECSEFSNSVYLTKYNNHNIRLEKYKNEILQLLYRDERLADVAIDDELKVDMVFYTDFCPFYVEEQECIKYNEITDNHTYQAIILNKFIDYMQNYIFEEGCISTRKLITDFIEDKGNTEIKSKLSNFLKKSIIQTGFADKYVDNINIYVTYKNYEELKKGLVEIVNKIDKASKKDMESEEFE